MKPWGSELHGRIDVHEIESEALRDNALGDPNRRPLWVYVPPGYDEEPDRRYPSIYVIQGLTGQLDMWRNRMPFRRNFPELADGLFASGDSPPALLVSWCMAACYSADDDGTVRPPFDVATGELIGGLWERWLEKGPVRMVARHAEA